MEAAAAPGADRDHLYHEQHPQIRPLLLINDVSICFFQNIQY
jgi:hypothetical protein